MSYHLGKKVKEIAESKGLSQTGLGKLVNLSKPGVASMYKRSGIDTELLIKLMEVLDYDFLAYIYENPRLKKHKHELTSEQNSQITSLKHENRFLKEIVSKNNLIIELQNKRISDLEQRLILDKNQ